MSLATLTWAFSVEVRPAAKKLVLLAIAETCDGDDNSRASIEQLSKLTSLDPPVIATALTSLLLDRLLTDVGRGEPVYHLNCGAKGEGDGT